MPMIVKVAGCKSFWIPGQARNEELGVARTHKVGTITEEPVFPDGSQRVWDHFAQHPGQGEYQHSLLGKEILYEVAVYPNLLGNR